MSGYYSLDGFCFCENGGKLPEGAVPVEAPFAPLVFLAHDASASARGFYAIQEIAELHEPTGVSLLKCLPENALPDKNSLGAFVHEHGAGVLNTAFSGAFELLRSYHEKQKKRAFRLTLVGLGDVGGTLLTGLKLLGTDIEEIGIFDPNAAQCERYEMEMNQILSIRDGEPLPRVIIKEKARLFDCDAFLFTASRGVPALNAGVKDVRMAQYSANTEMLKDYARAARACGFRGLFAQISDPVDHLSRAVFLESNKNENGIFDCGGLLPEQIQGYGLGVMRARAAYYAQRRGIECDRLLAYGPHGKGLIIANDANKNYDGELSKALSEAAASANLRVRELGFKPYIAPGLSSACVSVLRTLRGEWHDGAVPLGGAYFGCCAKMSVNGPIQMRRSICGELFTRLEQSYKELEMFSY